MKTLVIAEKAICGTRYCTRARMCEKTKTEHWKETSTL